MKIRDVLSVVNGRLIHGELFLEKDVQFGFASDLMSDVLTVTEENVLLITGLTGIQVIRTAVLSDITVILLVRGKKAPPEMAALAAEHDLVLAECQYSMFKTSGLLYKEGLKAIF
jgi:predicted transcriptional regulator